MCTFSDVISSWVHFRPPATNLENILDEAVFPSNNRRNPSIWLIKAIHISYEWPWIPWWFRSAAAWGTTAERRSCLHFTVFSGVKLQLWPFLFAAQKHGRSREPSAPSQRPWQCWRSSLLSQPFRLRHKVTEMCPLRPSEGHFLIESCHLWGSRGLLETFYIISPLCVHHWMNLNILIS